MTVDEPTRHELFSWFAEQMPERLAEAMMKSIPPTGWGDVATRNDLTAHAVLLRGEMAEVRGEMAEVRGEMDAFRSEIRAEISTLRSDLHGEITSLGSDLQSEIGTLRSDLQSEINGLHGEISAVRSSLVLTVVLASAASAASSWGVVLAAITLG